MLWKKCSCLSPALLQIHPQVHPQVHHVHPVTAPVQPGALTALPQMRLNSSKFWPNASRTAINNLWTVYFSYAIIPCAVHCLVSCGGGVHIGVSARLNFVMIISSPGGGGGGLPPPPTHYIHPCCSGGPSGPSPRLNARPSCPCGRQCVVPWPMPHVIVTVLPRLPLTTLQSRPVFRTENARQDTPMPPSFLDCLSRLIMRSVLGPALNCQPFKQDPSDPPSSPVIQWSPLNAPQAGGSLSVVYETDACAPNVWPPQPTDASQTDGKPLDTGLHRLPVSPVGHVMERHSCVAGGRRFGQHSLPV